MKKIYLCVASVCISAALLFSGCSGGTVKPNDTGIATGSIGQTFEATDRNFSVISAKKTESFGGYTPIDKEQLIEVVIKTTNTGKDAFSLSDVDYQLQWGDAGFTDALGIFDAEGTFLDSEILLEKGKSAEYHYLFSVPDHTASYSLCYLDPSTESDTQSLFYCKFNI